MQAAIPQSHLSPGESALKSAPDSGSESNSGEIGDEGINFPIVGHAKVGV
jgi:hypothetical protein